MFEDKKDKQIEIRNVAKADTDNLKNSKQDESNKNNNSQSSDENDAKAGIDQKIEIPLGLPGLEKYRNEKLAQPANRRKSIVIHPIKTCESEEQVKKEEVNENHFAQQGFTYLFVLIEIVVLILYGLFTTYPIEETEAVQKLSIYPLFQDVNVMIFIGFGFLMTFLKKYSWSAVGINYLLAAWTVQLSLLGIGFWRAVVLSEWNKKIHLDVAKIVDADFAAGSILISFGAVLGKLDFRQLLVMASIGAIFYSLEMNIVSQIYIANDIGGSLTIHTFGAYFGLTVAYFTKRKDVKDNSDNSANYNSNLFAMIGTIFLFMYWPSFNGALSPAIFQQRCFINTLLSISASCVTVFLLSFYVRKGRFHMEHILNATLAGGVLVGASADIIVQPWISFLFGLAAGILSLCGFEYIGPWLDKKFDLHDTCGVNSLHGMTGILGTLLSSFLVGFVKVEDYGKESFKELFPLIAKGQRSAAVQAAYTLAGLATVFGLAVFAGSLTGLLLKIKAFKRTNKLFDDGEAWEVKRDNSLQQFKFEIVDEAGKIETEANYIIGSS
jgi:ammonium transporter Rh